MDFRGSGIGIRGASQPDFPRLQNMPEYSPADNKRKYESVWMESKPPSHPCNAVFTL